MCHADEQPLLHLKPHVAMKFGHRCFFVKLIDIIFFRFSQVTLTKLLRKCVRHEIMATKGYYLSSHGNRAWQAIASMAAHGEYV